MSLVDGLPTLMAFWDADLKCRFANRAYGLWFGIDHRNIPGMTMAALVGEQSFASNAPMIDAALQGEQQHFERSMQCADGVLRNTMVTYLPSVIDGVTTGFVSHIVDVSRLKFAEDALLDEVGKHRNTIDALAEAVDAISAFETVFRLTLRLNAQIPWSTSANGSVTYINKYWEDDWAKLTGYRPPDSLSGNIAEIIHFDDRERAQANAQRYISTGTAGDDRYRFIGESGAIRWMRVRIAPDVDTAGNVRQWLGTLEDVHDQVLEEDQRYERDAAYRLTVELNGLIPWTTSADGTMFSVGDAVADRWAALTGRPASETVAEYRATAIHPADLKRIGVSRAAAIAAGHPIDYRYRLRMADGDYRWWHSRASPLLDPQGEVVRWYGTLEDIHDRVLEEERVQRLETELVHFGRLAAMNSLASTLAHELNQPLAAVMNYVNGARRLLASGDLDQVAAIDSALEAAATSTMGSAQIIRSLRDMVAKGAVNRCEENLTRIIDHACLLAIPDAKSNAVEIGIRIAPGLTTIHVDRVQFNQVLINLLRNAVDAVEARPVRKITIEARRAAGIVEISIADTGVGVATDRVDRLFEAFNSTKKDGLGIGLSISRTIVEANGGKLSYAEAPGGGACFTITIPDIC